MDNTENKTEFIGNAHLQLLIAEEKFYREYAEKIVDTIQAANDLTPEQYGYWFGTAQMMILIWRDRSAKLLEIRAELEKQLKENEFQFENIEGVIPSDSTTFH